MPDKKDYRVRRLGDVVDYGPFAAKTPDMAAIMYAHWADTHDDDCHLSNGGSEDIEVSKVPTGYWHQFTITGSLVLRVAVVRYVAPEVKEGEEAEGCED